jgi:kynurenine formamidase
MAGVDACSVDNQEGFPNHNTLLAGDVLPIENLTNLNGLVGKLFTVYALPLNIDLDGAPARVIARVD